ncbi:hypothetical protein KFK09_007911 [Dendrobium nobile]|uniref:Integrase catalytic domain-containing protein n=1 Tax=Dendrobium nobile TaxID=94219 RepID=A0A8T3BWH0_DENNO|nr:hypothetical protein KFK09_007911 [Dendrobium nobile]
MVMPYKIRQPTMAQIRFRQQTDQSCQFTIMVKVCYLFQTLRDHQPLLRGRLHNGVYQIRMAPDHSSQALQATVTSSSTWHARLGHPNNQIFNIIAPCIANLKNIPSDFHCISCRMGKSHKLKFNNSKSKTSKPFELIHSDVWGPIPQSEFTNFRYYIVFIDDFTRFNWIYFMNSKNQTINCFQNFLKLIQNQFASTPNYFRSDGGGEFTSTDFRTLLHSHGIIHQMSCPYTPEQNGLAERKHRHLLDLTRTLLHAANLPNKFWLDAISTANYLINRQPSKPLAFRSPYQLLFTPTQNTLISERSGVSATRGFNHTPKTNSNHGLSPAYS